MRFGDYLIEKCKIDREDLDVALKLKTEKGIRLGVLAVDGGILTKQQLSAILDHQREIANSREGIRLGKLVSDEYLDSISPDLRFMFRNKLIKGSKIFYDGLWLV